MKCDICGKREAVMLVRDRQDSDIEYALCGECYEAYESYCPCGCGGDEERCVYANAWGEDGGV